MVLSCSLHSPMLFGIHTSLLPSKNRCYLGAAAKPSGNFWNGKQPIELTGYPLLPNTNSFCLSNTCFRKGSLAARLLSNSAGV